MPILQTKKIKKAIERGRDDFRRQGVFSRLLVSYILILLLPICFSLVIYNFTIRDAERYTKSSNVAMLRNSSNLIENYFEEINRTALRFTLNQQLKELLTIKKIDNYDFAKVIDELSTYTVSDRFEVVACVYLRNSKKVIYDNTVYDAELFFNEILKYENRDFAKWDEFLFERSYKGEYRLSEEMQFERVKRNVVTYCQSLYTENHDFSEGVLMFFINALEIQKMLPQIDVANGSWFYIIDQNKSLICQIGDSIPPEKIRFSENRDYLEKHFKGKSVFITHILSEETNWRYVLALPRSSVMARVRYIKVLIYTMTLLSLILGFFGAYYLANRNSAPIRSIVKMISDVFEDDRGEHIGDIEFVTGKVGELIRNNERLSSEMQQQSLLAVDVFFDQLLKGDFKSNEQIEAFSHYIGVNFENKKFVVSILKMYRNGSQLLNEDILKELDMTKVLIKDTLKKILKGNAYLHDLDENNIAVLIMLPNDSDGDDAAQKLLEQIFEKIYSQYQVRVKIAVGDICNKISEASRSFEQARDAAVYFGREKGKQIIWHKNLVKDDDGYYYSIDLENRLMNAVKAGDSVEVDKYLQMLRDENYEKRLLSSEMLGMFLWELRGTMMKLRNQQEWSEELIEGFNKLNAVNDNSFSDSFAEIRDLYMKICDWVDNRKKSHNIDLKNKIVEFLEKTYQDPGLSLSGIAEKFNLTESYISQFFKEQTGENFSTCLEKIRMEHACELLQKTEMPINEISSLVGYYSDQVFRRAFKRYHGTTPNEFRTLMKSQELDYL